VQAFIPTPMTLATAMYWSGIDPMSKKPLFVAKEWKDRKIQQAMLQPHKPGHREILRRYKDGLGKPDLSKPEPRPGMRTVVQPPKKNMGRKLLLDER
jgi:hypothetical protein